ncbi:MAG TPA: PRC-barrel domain-containing protein [Candidatus Limnocylindrales bacterium]|nr:PRC-barrel domain-containing protein [Candidatus Limnocylindrales bacterium]
MRKGKTVIGKDVLNLADARILHTVKDLVIAADTASIAALLVDEGSLFSHSLVVPIENVESFGSDAVVVADSQAVMDAGKIPEIDRILDRKDKLVGKKVFTEGGDEQGSISDLYFDETNGRIVGFEISGGLIGNVTKGNSYLAVEDITRTGSDIVYIRPEGAESLDAQVGGIQGALGGARDKLGETAAKVKEPFGEASETARGQIAESRPEDSLVGRRVASDVEDDDGNVIVAANQRIRAEHVEQARQRNKVRELTAAATQGQAAELGEGATRAAGQAGDAAAGLWDQFTRKIGEMTDSTGKRLDEEKTKKRLSVIEDAVGRPTTKVILDRSDNVILDLGDIITHEAVQRAYDAGALDSLLGSVYKGDVAFSKEEMMAGTEGQATIEKASGEAPLLGELERKVEQSEQERDRQREEKRKQAEEDRKQREAEREERAAEHRAAAEKREAEVKEARATSSDSKGAKGTGG